MLALDVTQRSAMSGTADPIGLPTTRHAEFGKPPASIRRRSIASVILVAVFAALLGSVPVAARGAVADVLLDDTWVRSTTPTTNYGTGQNLVVGKGGHAYFRLDITDVTAARLESAVLNVTKYNNSATLLATRAGEFETAAGVETTSPWRETAVTWNTRPIDVARSPVVTATVPVGRKNVPLDITELILDAKQDGADVLTVHLTTEKVDDLNIAGTDIYSSRSTDSTARPWVDITESTDDVPSDYPVKRPFDDYPADGRVAQDVVRIVDDSGQYLRVGETGDIVLTDDRNAATFFAIYGSDYTASEYNGAGGGQQTTFGLKSLTNDRFLTIQNYAGGAGRPYYTKSGSDYVVTATAEELRWNERFYIQHYAESDSYGITSHLDALRDESEAPTSTARMDAAGMRVTPGDRVAYRYTFESVAHPILEPQQRVAGTTATLSWLPVLGDQDPAHYSVDGATVGFADGRFTASVTGLPAGEHTFTVRYTGGADALNADVTARVFSHPGVSLTEDQLDAMRVHVAEKAEPWYSDYLRLKNTVPNGMSSLDFQVTAHAGVGRGTPAGSGNIGDYEQSSAAAYSHALQWAITRDSAHADKVVEIADAWATTLTQIDGRDQILGAGLSTHQLINAVEIVRYYDGGYAGYNDESFAAFQRMLREVVYPVIQDAAAPMNANGNWDQSALQTLAAIGVVTEDAAIFDSAVEMYNSPFINGSIENYVTDWGQAAESARDQAHAQLGLGLLAAVATIANNQGVNLWAVDDNKLARAFNWVAEYNMYDGEGSLRAEPVPNVFGRTDNNAYWDEMEEQAINRGQLRPVYEGPLAYYSTVEGVDVTWMSRAAAAMRPEGFIHLDHSNFTTLTSYNGEPTAPSTPYFQMRTTLTPWYQGNWSAVSAWGELSAADRALTPGGVLPEGFTTETLPSYFGVQDDGTIAIEAMQDTAPYFRLVTNDDETYSVQDVASGLFLGVTETVIDGAHTIEATARTIGDPQKFELRSTAVGRVYLVKDDRLVTVAVTGTTSAPRDATLSLRLGTELETSSFATTTSHRFWLSYASGSEVDKASLSVQDSTITVGDEWEPADNISSATDHRGEAIEDLTQVAHSGEVDTTTPGTYEVTFYSGTAVARGTVTVEPAGLATATPGKLVLSDDNWDKDGDFTLTMNMWWGQNATQIEWYENGTLVHTQKLTDATPNAQSATLAISGKANGSHIYTAVLTNRYGSTHSAKLTVPVTAASPGTPEVSSDNRDKDGSYTITMNMWWGTNATTYRLYENGVLIDEQPLIVDGRNAQSATTAVTGRATGEYRYEAVLSNAQGETRSKPLAVKVTR